MNAPTTFVQPRQAAPDLVLPGSLTAGMPSGCFGLSSARLALRADATLDDVLLDALSLLDEGVQAVEAAATRALNRGNAGDPPTKTQWAAVWVLRQARMLLAQAQLTHDQAAAAAAAGWKVEQ
jgi:hypothetical protein